MLSTGWMASPLEPVSCLTARQSARPSPSPHHSGLRSQSARRGGIRASVEEKRVHRAQHHLPVSVILVVSMTAAGIVYPVTDSALHHTSPIMIAALRALVGGALLTAMLPLMGSQLPRSRRLWLWAFAIGLGNTTLTQVGISVGTERAGAAVASVLLNSSPFFVAAIARFALAESITRLRAAGLMVGGVPLIPLVLAAGGSTDWGRPSLIAQLAYLVIGGQLLVYLGFNASLSRWPSTRVYAWTFLVPVVAVVIQAFRGALPGVAATVGVALVILGVAIVNHPRAEGSVVVEGQDQPIPAEEIGLPTAEAP